MTDSRRCRFCGIKLTGEDGDSGLHPTCAEPGSPDDDLPAVSPAHPMYPKKPIPLQVPG